MRIRTVATVDTEASAAAVFDAANGVETVAEAFPGYGPVPAVTGAEVVGGGPLAAGKTRRVSLGDGHVVEEEMLVFDRGHACAYTLRGIAPPFALLVRQGRADWTFAQSSAGTRVRWQYEFELTSPLAWPVASPFLHLVFNGWMRGCLRRMCEIAARSSSSERPRRTA